MFVLGAVKRETCFKNKKRKHNTNRSNLLETVWRGKGPRQPKVCTSHYASQKVTYKYEAPASVVKLLRVLHNIHKRSGIAIRSAVRLCSHQRPEFGYAPLNGGPVFCFPLPCPIGHGGLDVRHLEGIDRKRYM